MNQLIYRVTKGSPLTDLELDDNFRKLFAAVQALEATSGGGGGTGSGIQIGGWYGYCGTTEPSDALFMNGRAVSRVTYSALFAVIGIQYGAGDGVSTFNLPDWRGSVVMGANPMGGLTKMGLATRTAGTYYGAESVSIPHSHDASASLTIDEFNITPSGSVTVASYTGSVPVTIDTTNIAYVPEGAVSVEIANHTGILSESGAGHNHDVFVPPVQVTNTGESLVDVGQTGTFTTTDRQVSIDLSTQPLVHDVTDTGFTGTPTNFNHTHSANNIDISHGHNASFSGSVQQVEPTGSAEVTVDSASPSASVIQPSGVSGFVIKYK